MGTSFVGKVRDVWQIAEAQIGEGVADMVEFEAQSSGLEATEKANRIQAWQSFRLAILTFYHQGRLVVLAWNRHQHPMSHIRLTGNWPQWSRKDVG